MEAAVATRRALRQPGGQAAKRAKISEVFLNGPFAANSIDESPGTPLDEAHMHLIAHCVSSDENVHSMAHLYLNAILGDGCLAIRRGGETIVLTDRFSRWFDDEFGQAARACAYDLVSFGLCCVAVEREKKETHPIVIDPLHAGIKIKVKNGRNTYNITGDLDPEAVFSPRVFVLDPPGHNGEIRSGVAACADLCTQLRLAAEISLQAQREGADPPCVVQQR